MKDAIDGVFCIHKRTKVGRTEDNREKVSILPVQDMLAQDKGGVEENACIQNNKHGRGERVKRGK